MTLYAAYGSNMDPAQMMRRCPHSPAAGTGWLPGHRLTFGGEELGWEGSLATVVPDEAHSVFVALYELSERDEKALDAWEGADRGLYVKLRVRVLRDALDELAGELAADGPAQSGPTDESLLAEPLLVEPRPGELLAWLYVLDGYEGGLPSARYLGLMADAAESAGAPADYVSALRQRECRSLGD